MDLIWVVPLAVVALGVIPAVFAATRLRAEVTALRGDLRNWGPVRPALVEVRSDADELRQRLEVLRLRR